MATNIEFFTGKQPGNYFFGTKSKTARLCQPFRTVKLNTGVNIALVDKLLSALDHLTGPKDTPLAGLQLSVVDNLASHAALFNAPLPGHVTDLEISHNRTQLEDGTLRDEILAMRWITLQNGTTLGAAYSLTGEIGQFLG